MSFWIAAAAALLAAYLCGSLPTGYLAGRLLKGVDIRDAGSGSTGATNVLRTLGQGPFWAVLGIDVLKGSAAVAVADLLNRPAAPLIHAPGSIMGQAWGPWIVSLAGIAAILGHSRPIWLGFAGGKSVAVGLGVLLAMAWPVGVGALTAFGIVLAVSRIMSLSSMSAAITAIVLALSLDLPLPYRLMVIAGGGYVIVRHRANIGRLLAGTEPRVGKSVAG